MERETDAGRLMGAVKGAATRISREIEGREKMFQPSGRVKWKEKSREVKGHV